MSVKIVLLGSKGIVGSEILTVLKDKYEVYSFNHKELDITDKIGISNILEKIRPKYLINAAAYTQVNEAEKNNALCYEINSNAVKNIAFLCKINNIHLIHFSTDYIYDGDKKLPYVESDLANPLNIYGDSKNRGDQYIISSKCNYTIFRTSWVYGSKGHNFVKSILKNATIQGELKVVSDQYGTPTSSYLIAEVINIFLLNAIEHKNNINENQVFNLCSSGFTTWYNFAAKIIQEATKINSKYNVKVVPTTSSNYNSTAKRPSYTVLSNQKICSCFDIDIKNWEYYLIHFLRPYIK